MQELPAALARQLLSDTRLSVAETEERLRLAWDADYWRRLAPDLRVESDAVSDASADVSASAVDAAVRSLRDDSVYHVQAAISQAHIAVVNSAIDRVIGAGWPAVFAFVYDELWSCIRVPSVTSIASRLFGTGIGLIPKVWVHVVKPPSAGWRPHVDGESEGRLTCWLALTEATIDNGCMYLLPRRRSVPRLRERLAAGELFTGAELTTLLQGATPMPAAAGDAVGWTFDVVHWGGHARLGAPVRRSLSFEFIADNQTPDADEVPVLPLIGALPPFQFRIREIGRGMRTYRTFEPLLERFAGVAERILS